MIFSYLKTLVYILWCYDHLTVPFVNLPGVGPMWAFSVSFVYTVLLVWAFPQLHKLNLSYCLKSSLLLVFCFLFVCVVDQTHVYPSCVLLLRLFRGIICNIERLKGGKLEPRITGGTWFERVNLRPLMLLVLKS